MSTADQRSSDSTNPARSRDGRAGDDLDAESSWGRSLATDVGVVQPFAGVAVAAIVAGGIVAAVTGPTDWRYGSWVAAFLVLVVGVGQLGLAAGQAALAAAPPPLRWRVRQAVCFNGSSALVVAGTLASHPAVVTTGCVAFAAALSMFVRGRTRRDASAGAALVFRALLVVLIVSAPVGAALSWIRA